ncbi:MAG TPA: NUDIX hydrolase [Candidatus Paceibacterota bacterium]|jgi:8-oxo-dGTP diphosphatase|nr:NUDIX hydrolase [Candidatus Paceibacterota bacterium]
MFVSQKAIVWNKDGKMLGMRRSETDPSRPLTWDLPGGELEEGEDVRESLRREVIEESGLTIDELNVVDVYGKTGHDGQYWVMILYETKALEGEVRLSFEHDQFEWLTIEEFLARKSSGKIEHVLREYEHRRQN